MLGVRGMMQPPGNNPDFDLVPGTGMQPRRPDY